MPDAPCEQPDCPIVAPDQLDRRRLRVVTLPANTERWRVTRSSYAAKVFTPAGVGNARFSPLADHGHTYVAEQRSAALLESALHEAAGTNPRIYAATLADQRLHRVRFSTPLRLIDLRDPALERLGVTRAQLTGSGPRHYACTRRVAEHLVETKASHGFVWTSRQGVLHAERNRDGLADEVLRHASLDVAVVYSPEYSGRARLVDSEPLLVDGSPTRFILELANLLQIAIL